MHVAGLQGVGLNPNDLENWDFFLSAMPKITWGLVVISPTWFAHVCKYDWIMKRIGQAVLYDTNPMLLSSEMCPLSHPYSSAFPTEQDYQGDWQQIIVWYVHVFSFSSKKHHKKQTSLSLITPTWWSKPDINNQEFTSMKHIPTSAVIMKKCIVHFLSVYCHQRNTERLWM